MFKLEDKHSPVDGVTITVRNTMRETMRYRAIVRAIETSDGQGTDDDIRWSWVWANAYGTDVKGLSWQPSDTTNPEDLAENFARFRDNVPVELADTWYSRVMILKAPFAHPETKHDDLLTDEEKKTPS